MHSFTEVVTTGLLKLYGPTRALAGVSLTFRAGEIAVVEGPNGSGKSTLLSLLGLTAKPTAGTIHFGQRGSEQLGVSARRAIGVLSHEPMLYPELTGRENLRLFARLFLPQKTAAVEMAQRIDNAVSRFGLKSFLDRPTRTYSRGQLQRVALARALLHRPQLLLLDEPSTGLDERSTQALWAAIREEQHENRIVVMVTHDATCAEQLGARRIHFHKGTVESDSAAPGAAP